MVVVAADSPARVDGSRRATSYRQSQNVAITIEQERRTIARPVGRLEVLRRNVDHAAVSGCDRHRFQRAVKLRLGRWGGRSQINPTENSFLDRVLVVGANSDSHIKRSLER